jgi:hypothetical protein
MSDEQIGPSEVESDPEQRGWDAAIEAALKACVRVGNANEFGFKYVSLVMDEIAKLEMGGGL